MCVYIYTYALTLSVMSSRRYALAAAAAHGATATDAPAIPTVSAAAAAAAAAAAGTTIRSSQHARYMSRMLCMLYMSRMLCMLCMCPAAGIGEAGVCRGSAVRRVSICTLVPVKYSASSSSQRHFGRPDILVPGCMCCTHTLLTAAPNTSTSTSTSCSSSSCCSSCNSRP